MNEPDSSTWPVRNLPWVTVATAVIAVALYSSPSAIRALQYDRLAIVAGEWWRVFTGNWVHFSQRELVWNLAVIIPAGIWAEKLVPLRARILFVLAPALVGSVLFFFLPEVSRFGGLSGFAAAIVAFLAIAQLRTTDSDRWFWRLVLGLLALKIAAEAVLASHWVSKIPDPTARVAALVHLAGIAAGSLVLSARRRAQRT